MTLFLLMFMVVLMLMFRGVIFFFIFGAAGKKGTGGFIAGFITTGRPRTHSTNTTFLTA